MHYRRDIDGLRALAILPVILFHAGVPGMSGGFVGVDVFFVISGFLITRILSEDIQHGRFSLVNFYERRVRRILPALFAMVAVVAVVCWFLFLPQDFKDFGESLAAMAAFGSNIYFWQNAGYFAGPAQTKPLLHTWSLCVEDQFYIFFPLFLFWLFRYGRSRVIAVLAAVFVVSLALSIWAVEHKPMAAFYLAPTRAWELMLGGFLALGAVPPVRNKTVLEILGMAGIALITGSAILFDANTRFPGLNALYPCIGAGLLLYAGMHRFTLAARILSIWPLVFIGLISYSLYLWHWPVLVLAQYYAVYPLTPIQTALCFAGTGVLAVLSWKYVEQPFRHKDGVLPRRPLFKVAAGLAAVYLVLGLGLRLLDGLPGRLPMDVVELASYVRSYEPRRSACHSDMGNVVDPEKNCVYGADTEPHYALWGDSHAGVVIAPLSTVAKAHGAAVRYFGYGGCPPVIGVVRQDRSDSIECLNYNDNVLSVLEKTPSLTHVLLVARWTFYLEGGNKDLGVAEVHDTQAFIMGRDGRRLERNERYRLFSEHLSETIRRLHQAGKQVTILYPIPETGYEVPSTLARLKMQGIDDISFFQPTPAYYQQRHQYTWAVLDQLPATVQRLYPAPAVCAEEACAITENDTPLYMDDDHLSLLGAQRLVPVLEPLFQGDAKAAE